MFPPGTYTRLYLRGEECKTAPSVPLLLQQSFTNLQNCGERKILWPAVPARAAPPPSAACEDRLCREAWAYKGRHHVERGFLLVRGSQQRASEHKPSTSPVLQFAGVSSAWFGPHRVHPWPVKKGGRSPSPAPPAASGSAAAGPSSSSPWL